MKKNPVAALIVKGLDGDSTKESPEDSENMMNDEEIAADDLITAIHEEDPTAFLDAFKALMASCGYGEKEEVGEEDSEN
jgi:hypothetical protein